MSTHADSLAVRPTIRLPMAVVCTAAIATINFKIVAALPDLPKSESFQDILVGTTAGLVVATALGRLFFGCSFRRALSALLGGVALGWIGGIAVGYFLAFFVFDQGFFFFRFDGLTVVVDQDSPWMMAWAIWLLGPFLNVAVLSRDLKYGRRPTIWWLRLCQVAATVPFAVPLAVLLYGASFLMSLYGRRRGYVTVGTAPIAAPWLAFMISDWLVRTAIALKSRRDRLGGMMDAATR